jgi:hypothetical protein
VIPVLSAAAVILLLCQCHRARQQARHWRDQARLAEMAMEGADRREAQREALRVGLLADSFQELGALSVYRAEDWQR